MCHFIAYSEGGRGFEIMCTVATFRKLVKNELYNCGIQWISGQPNQG